MFLVIEYFVIRASLKSKGYNLRENSFITFVKFFLNGTWTALHAVFSLYDLKFFIIYIAGFALGVTVWALTHSTPLAIAIIILFSLAYLLVVVRNLMRLLPAQGHFLLGRGIRESVLLSWNTTAGMAAKIFVLNFLVTIPISLLNLGGGILQFVFELPGNNVLHFVGIVAASVFSALVIVSGAFAYAGFFEWIYRGKPPLPASAKQAKIKEGKKAKKSK